MDNITINLDGSAEFASSRIPAWHRLGTTPGRDLSVMEGADLAGLLNWNLRKVPLVAVDHQFNTIPVPNKHLVLRDQPGTTNPRALGVVGDRYTLSPQEEWLPFVEGVLGTSGGADHGVYVDAMGSIDGGRVVFATLAFEGGIFQIGGFDTHRTYLVVLTSHDGSHMLTARPTYTRVVCENTIRAMLGEPSSQTYRVKHTAGITKQTIEDAQKAIGLTFEVQSQIADEAEKFLAAQVNDATFEKIIAASFPEMDKVLKAQADQVSKRSLTMAENKRAALWQTWRSDTVAGAGIGGTAWGAMNAIGEYLDWGQSVKNSGEDGYGTPDNARAVRDLATPEQTEIVKARAYKVTKALVGV